MSLKALTRDSIQKQAEKYLDGNAEPGNYVGFECLRDLYSHKRGTCTDWTGAPASGKCLAKGTKIIMANGALKNVEDIEIGDYVASAEGRHRLVMSLGHGTENMYRISQQMGMTYEVNESHILSLKCGKNVYGRYKTLPAHNKRGALLNISVKDYLNLPKNRQVLHKGWKSYAEFPAQSTEFEPYFLGVWLGDGCSTFPSVAIPDIEVIDYMREYCLRLGITLKTYKGINGKIDSFALTDKGLVKSILRNLNLLGNKHIPDHYIQNSYDNRMQLLAGLVDTDGHLVKGGHNFEITQKNKTLAYQIKYLADTLGFRTSINSKIATMRRKDGSIYSCEVYRVYIGGDISKIPTKIKRKQAISNVERGTRYTAIKVEPIGIGEYFGFTLDGDGLFLLEDGTVTHNTYFCLETLFNQSEVFGERHGLYVPDIGSDKDVIAKLVKMHCGKDYTDRFGNKISKPELSNALDWILHHFILFGKEDFKTGVTPLLFWETICDYKDGGGILHNGLIDSWKNMSHIYNGREDSYLDEILSTRNEMAEKYNKHFHTIAHAVKTESIEQKGKRRIPNAWDIKGGGSWYANGKNIVTVDFPDKNKFGVDLYISKVKPEDVGKVGEAVGNIFLDPKRGRYYETANLDILGIKYFSFEMEKGVAIQKTQELPF